MTTPEAPDSVAMLAMRVRTLQIIIGALVAGLLTFILIVSFISFFRAHAAAPNMPIITYVACFLACIQFPLSLIVPSQVVASGRKQLATKPPADDTFALMNLYQTKTIITGALRQGVGFLAAIAFMIERQPISLGLAVVCMVAVAVLFPTRERVDQWLDDQLVRLSQEREFGV